MRSHAWKVPGIVLAAALVGACGGDAESAADEASERVIPAADAVADAPEPQPEPAEDVAEPVPTPEPEPAARPAPEAVPERAAPRRTAPAPAEATGGEPLSTPPTETVRTEPEPAPVPDLPVERRPEPLAVPVGARIVLSVDQELSTKVNTTGDAFDATVSEDLLGGDGVVLLPRGTRVRGRVLESFESPDSDRPATLALGVESVELGGRLVAMAATVTELEHETEARDSDTRTAAKVGAGAVAGALLGKIIGGDGKDAVKGAVAGVLAGAAVAHATRDGHAKVPLGARMVVVLDERLVVEPVQEGGGDG